MTNGEKSCSIEELTDWCSPEIYFRIKDPSGKVIYKISHNRNTKDSYEFEVFTNAHGPNRTTTRIGKVSKTWFGLPHPDQHLSHLYGI